MPELMPLLPYALAALLGAWCAWLTWRLRRVQQAQVTQQLHDTETRRQVIALARDVGWSDERTKTRLWRRDV